MGGQTDFACNVLALPIPRGLRSRGPRASEGKGIAQEQLALKSRLNRGYYSDVERGESNVSLANILEIAGALEVPPSAIFTRSA